MCVNAFLSTDNLSQSRDVTFSFCDCRSLKLRSSSKENAGQNWNLCGMLQQLM